MEVNIKLTPKQEKQLREYCNDDSLRMEFVMDLAQGRNITIEQAIAYLKKSYETDLEMTGDILMD